MKSVVKNYDQSPLKVRGVVNTIQGKNVHDALMILSTLDSKSALCLKKSIKSAVNNAIQSGVTEVEKTHKVHICVDKGISMRRFRPLARGRANPYRKIRSHISIALQSV